MSEQHIGSMIDELGVTLRLSDTQRLTHVFVIGKVMDLDTGQSYLVLGSNGLDWIDEGALLHGAMESRSASVLSALITSDCEDPDCHCSSHDDSDDA